MNSTDKPSEQSARLRTIGGQHAQTLLDWLSWADNDYVAARRLLLDKLLVQGTSLTCTALEKYLKAVLASKGKAIPRLHDPHRLYLETGPDPNLRLDEDFLAMLSKAYELRYPDELQAGYNVVLSQALIMSALDESVSQITKGFSIRKGSGDELQRRLDILLQGKDPRLLASNTALGTLTKDELFAMPSAVFEMRILSNGTRIEIEYTTTRIDNRSFSRDAFVQLNEKQFQLVYPPLQG